ncbi:MAG TPA: hypothetical protein DCQ98_19870 [Planctomycetaceae bacterium]|nr:hypothetical protein [Planctomycetaceae bacterium]HRF00054.1 hypothetical protein [Pirellulaceae bacterium]
MDQRDLDEAVARATGERLARVRRRGFSLLRGGVMEREPQVVDWDAVDESFRVGMQRPPRKPR